MITPQKAKVKFHDNIEKLKEKAIKHIDSQLVRENLKLQKGQYIKFTFRALYMAAITADPMLNVETVEDKKFKITIMGELKELYEKSGWDVEVGRVEPTNPEIIFTHDFKEE